MDWNLILKDIGIITVISGLITWLIKSLGESLINKNQKNYEQKLHHETEKFKSDLNFLSQKANKLHDRRIDRIEELYNLLNEFHSDMQVLVTWKIVTGMSNEDIKKQEFDNVKKAEASGNKFLSYYSRHKLYFNIETCNLIDDIIKLLKESHFDFTFKYIFGNISAEMEYKNIKTATNKIKEIVPDIKQKLEDNFRIIIGVN